MLCCSIRNVDAASSSMTSLSESTSNCLRMSYAIEWSVPSHIPEVLGLSTPLIEGCSNILSVLRSILSRNSAAALLVKVVNTIDSGGTPSTIISLKALSTRTSVLPVPGPASTQVAGESELIASSCPE